MKNIVLPLLLIVVLLCSCQKEETTEVATRDDYIGTWQCEEYDASQLLVASFLIEIFTHPSDSNRVLIDNFSLLGQGFTAEGIVNSTEIDFPQQLVSSTSINGNGFITNNLTSLELQYNLDDGSGQPETITATCTKL